MSKPRTIFVAEESGKMAKDPCEICREQVILELFARIGGRTLGQKDCENCNVRRERKDE